MQIPENFGYVLCTALGSYVIHVRHLIFDEDNILNSHLKSIRCDNQNNSNHQPITIVEVSIHETRYKRPYLYDGSQHIYMDYLVVKARKQYKVPYPQLYADSTNKDAKKFNCVQRGHQNSLENESSFLSLLLLAGCKYPISASISGSAYLLSRILYCRGYSTGDPNARLPGSLGVHLTRFALIGMIGRWAFQLLSS